MSLCSPGEKNGNESLVYFWLILSNILPVFLFEESVFFCFFGLLWWNIGAVLILWVVFFHVIKLISIPYGVETIGFTYAGVQLPTEL